MLLFDPENEQLTDYAILVGDLRVVAMVGGTRQLIASVAIPQTSPTTAPPVAEGWSQEDLRGLAVGRSGADGKVGLPIGFNTSYEGPNSNNNISEKCVCVWGGGGVTRS